MNKGFFLPADTPKVGYAELMKKVKSKPKPKTPKKPKKAKQK